MWNRNRRLELQCFSTWNAVNWGSLNLSRLFRLFYPPPSFTLISHSFSLALTHTYSGTQKECPCLGWCLFMRLCWGRVKGWRGEGRGRVHRQVNSPLLLLCEGSACCTQPRSHSACKHTNNTVSCLEETNSTDIMQLLFALSKCILIEDLMELKATLSILENSPFMHMTLCNLFIHVCSQLMLCFLHVLAF